MTTRGRDRIFRWHAVLDTPADAFAAFTTTTAAFLAEVESIAGRYEIVPLRGLVGERGASRRPRAALTFDDALECQARHAFPVLESKRLPYTICIPTEPITAGRPIWSTLLRLCLLRTSARSIDLGWMSIDLSSPGVDRASVAGEVQDLLLGMYEPAWAQAVEALSRQCADVLDDCMANDTIRPMTWAGIQSLDPALCEAASHSRLHRPAVQGDAYATVLADARGSRAEIEDRLQRACVTYCFPYGVFTADSVAAVREAGYTTLLTSCRVPPGVLSHGLEGRFEGSDLHSPAAGLA